jgi:berberine-like enzyme
VMRKAPPLPFLPEDVHGKEVAVLAICYTGDFETGQKLVAPLRKFGTLVGEHVGPAPYVNWQQAFDPLLTPGARNYWKSHNFTQLGDGVFDSMIEYTGNLPSPHCEIFLGCLSGAPNRVSNNATAYQHREVKYIINVHSRWETPEEDNRCILWARDFFKASLPFASGGAYVNFMTEEEGERIASVYGGNYGRLVEIKKKYDPQNVFHHNQNIAPKA